MPAVVLPACARGREVVLSCRVQGKVTSLRVSLQHDIVGRGADYPAARVFHAEWPPPQLFVCVH